MRRTVLASAVACALLAISAPASAQVDDGCTVVMTEVGATVTATPSPECGPLHLAVFSYADGAPGIWSPGAFDFDETLPQLLASAVSGDDILATEAPCGLWQADVWLASGPPVPGSITNEFLEENYAGIVSSVRGGLHGERQCDAEVGSEGVVNRPAATDGPEVAGVQVTRTRTASAATPTSATPTFVG